MTHFSDVMISAISNCTRLDFLVNRLFGRGSNKTSKLRVIGFCEVNPPVTGEFPSQRAINAENVFIWWRCHGALFHSKRNMPSWIHELNDLVNPFATVQSLWSHRPFLWDWYQGQWNCVIRSRANHFPSHNKVTGCNTRLWCTIVYDCHEFVHVSAETYIFMQKWIFK